MVCRRHSPQPRKMNSDLLDIANYFLFVCQRFDQGLLIKMNFGERICLKSKSVQFGLSFTNKCLKLEFWRFTILHFSLHFYPLTNRLHRHEEMGNKLIYEYERDQLNGVVIFVGLHLTTQSVVILPRAFPAQSVLLLLKGFPQTDQ